MKKNILVLALIALLAAVPMTCFAEATDQDAPDYQSPVTQTLDA